MTATSTFAGARSGFGGAFAGRRVLVTGHTGFKGAWLSLWLKRLGASVHGLSVDVPTDPSLYGAAGLSGVLDGDVRADIRDAAALDAAVAAADPEIVFHLAAQSLVRESYRTPMETFAVNVMGTLGVLDTLRRRGRPAVVVLATSDKCYDNREQVWGYREIDPMGGADPYSASKGCAELALASFRRSFFPPERVGEHGVKVASVRAGNVIGGGDWAADRIGVDLVRGFSAGKAVRLRNPSAVRPWQHVLEPLSGYLTLAARMLASDDARWCDGWNFGPAFTEIAPVGRLSQLYAEAWGDGAAVVEAPDPAAPHESHLLQVNIDKAVSLLGWRPSWGLRDAVTHTVGWYKGVAAGGDARAATLADIAAYEAASA